MTPKQSSAPPDDLLPRTPNPEDGTAVRVFVVEDEIEVRSRLCEVIQSDLRLRLVGSADTASSARRWLTDSRHGMDVMLVDLGLPDGSGLNLIAECKNLRPQASIMVMTMFSDPGHVFAALEHGAAGYLLKSTSGETLAEQVLDLYRGGSPITPSVARLVLQKLSSAVTPPGDGEAEADAVDSKLPPAEALTAREVNVLNLIAIGYSYAEISGQLQISQHTVNAHIRSIYQKLHVHSRSEAVFEGQRRGLLSTPKP